MQGDDVAGLEDLVPGRVERPKSAPPLVRGEHRPHAERPADFRDPLAENALADDAEVAAVQIPDRKVEEAELPALPPTAAPHRVAVGQEIASQREDQGERMFGDGVDRIAADV